MSALETLRKESLERHLVRLLTALIKDSAQKEIRIRVGTLLGIETGEAVTETLDETTQEVVIRYSGRGSQHLIIGPTREELRQNEQEHPKTPSQRTIKTDAELADMEAHTIARETLLELGKHRPRTGEMPFPFSGKPEGDFAP